MRFFSNDTLENQVCRPKSGINLYPFGQTMPGRNWMSTVGGYRYANQGKEKDDEIFSGAQDFEARELDNRIGRFWSLDPHQNRYPSSSPYSVTYNSPNLFVDKDGRDNIIYIVDFSSNNPALNLPNAAAQLQKAVDAITGTDKVKVVVVDPKDFYKSKLDPTDAVLMFGDIDKMNKVIKSKYGDILLPDPTIDNPENTNIEHKVSKISDKYVADWPNKLAQDAKLNSDKLPNQHEEPGNSAQDALVLTMLHSVGHMVAKKKGHADDGLYLNGEKSYKSYYESKIDPFRNNFLMDGQSILNIVNMNHKNRLGLDWSLTSFSKFTYAPWNKGVFKGLFKGIFKSSKPQSKLRSKF